MGFLFTYDEPQVFATEATIAGNPELDVNQDTTYTADARPATEVIENTDRPTQAKWWVIGHYRAAGSSAASRACCSRARRSTGCSRLRPSR